MTGLRSALQSGEISARWPRGQAPAATLLRRAVTELKVRDELDLSALDLAAVQDRLMDAVARGALSASKRRDLREGARGFLSGPRPVGRDKGAATAVLGEIARRSLRSAILALVGVYLEQFKLADDAILELGAWLERGWSQWRWSGAEVWENRARVWRLFDPTNGPTLLADKTLSEPVPQLVLAAAGLEGNRAFGGYGEVAFSLACKAVFKAEGTALQVRQERLIAWSRRDNRFGYDRLWPDFARALVEPWDDRSGEGVIASDHRSLIINELITYAGDPRTGSRLKWAMLDGTPAQRTLLRWLTRASVTQFFDIVDRTADRHMWAYRRAFWMSYLLADHIDAAWVAFGDNGARLAMQAARQTNDEGLAQFGRVQRATGKSSDHAALIMRIGDLTIADWSHNGKYNIWRRGKLGAPVLFRKEYTAYELSNAPNSGSHVSSATLNWQRRIALEIAQQTNRRVRSDQWQPKLVR